MIKNARGCLLFTAMCLVTTSLSSLELNLGTPDQLRPPTSSVLVLLTKLVAKPTLWTWTVDTLYLEVTFHVSAAMAGIGVSLLALLAKYKNVSYLYVPWLIFAFNGILENQALQLAYNTRTIVTAPNHETLVIVFHLMTLTMLVEEFLFWFAVLREFIAGAHCPFVRWFPRAATRDAPGAPDLPATDVAEVSTGERLDAGDYQPDASQTGGVDVGDKTGPAATKDQGDTLETEITPEQELHEDQSNVPEQRDGHVDSAVEVEISNSEH